MFIATLLATALLTNSDIGALRSSKLAPNSTNAIGAIVDERPVVLARMTYATYAAPLPVGTPVLATFLFPAGALQPGDQLVAVASGTAVNNSAGIQNLGMQMLITQTGIASQTFGTFVALPNTYGAAAIAWRSEVTVGVNIPGADGQYLAPALTASAVPATQSPRDTLAGAAVGFAGSGSTVSTDTLLNAAGQAGGRLVAGTNVQSELLATTTQRAFSNAYPIQVQLILYNLSVAGPFSITVQAGYVMGL